MIAWPVGTEPVKTIWSILDEATSLAPRSAPKALSI
jgi:hypothetical protein